MRGKVNNIQALRAYAALAVVVYHSGYIFPHMLQMGKFGVDLFFVISGYIMARVCETNTRFFLRRRLIRIIPPYWLCTIALFFFALHWPNLLLSTHPSVGELLKSLLFIPYYRVGLIRPVLYVGWSLNLEMLFYLLVAASIVLVPKHPLVVTTTFIAALHVICKPLASMGAIPDCYSDIRMFEFLLGIGAYEAARRVGVEVATRFRSAFLLVLLTSLAGIILLQGHFEGAVHLEWAYMQILSASTVFSASVLSRGGWDLKTGWIVLIGDASYILYLAHVYVLNLADRVLRHYVSWLRIDEFAGCVTVTFICVLVALVLHVKLEKPSVAFLNERFGGHRKTREFSDVRIATKEVTP